MKYRLKSQASIEAIQWTGDNLKEVQEFMWPSSPLDHNKREDLGVNVFCTKPYSPTELAFVRKGGYIVRDDQGLHIFTPEAFDARYEPA